MYAPRAAGRKSLEPPRGRRLASSAGGLEQGFEGGREGSVLEAVPGATEGPGDRSASRTRRSLFGTDTQRGVLTGLSRERNLRSKI